MIRNLFTFLIGIFLLGCSPSRVAIGNLELKDNRYYLKNTRKPYTGTVFSRFENGRISNIIAMKDGIPNGKWQVFGLAKEIVQEGAYYPVDVKQESEFERINVSRLNVCITKEGSIEFTDVYLITDKETSNDKKDIKPLIFSFLKNQAIPIKGDSINEIKYVKGELEE